MKPKLYVTSKDVFFEEKDIFECPDLMPAAQQVRADESSVLCRHRGFGVAVTGSSCYLLSKMTREKRDAFLADIYGKDGLGLSVGRLSIGSSDYSAELYCYDDTPDDIEMRDFSVARDEAYVIPMVREVVKHAPDIKLYASPWSPPGWMKTGGSMCGGYMREQYVDAMAKYMVKFAQEYEKRGIHLMGFTPQNEPETHQGGKMPASMLHPDLEAKLILALRRELKANGMDTEIWMHDHNFGDAGRVEWLLDTYPELPEAVNGVGWHYYNGSVEFADPIKAKYPRLSMHMTEGGPRLSDNYAVDWCKWGGLMAKMLNRGFETFTGWNLLLDQCGEPNIGPFDCGGLVTEDSHTGELSYSGQYKAFKHFSGLIRPGAQICSVEVTNDAKKGRMTGNGDAVSSLTFCAAKNPDSSRVLNAVNPSSENVQIQVDLDGKKYYVRLAANSISSIVY